MKKLRCTLLVEKGPTEKNFACYMVGNDNLKTHVYGVGSSARKAIEDYYEAEKEAKKWAKEDGEEYPEIEYDIIFDVGSYFDYYPVNVTAFANYIGMNASLLRQYASGAKNPQAKSLKRIQEGFLKLSKDMNAGNLIEKPVLSYI